MKIRKKKETALLEDDPLWYKDAIIYEAHVRAYADSNADGIGDFRGLLEKLDYLQDLGVTAIWLLPFYPSPLRDDGYDIAGYTDVNPIYGSLPDLKAFLREAHRRGLRVITELVINHTSDQHPWFQRARRSPPGSTWRDFYVWSDTPDKFKEARIIFSDFEASNWTFDPVAKSYYWHRFYSHQPDLNFDNPAVQKAVFAAMDFWLDLGIDGLRLDAVPYLYEREGSNCENLPETHAFLKKLRRHVDEHFRNRMLLAEANQWPEDAAAYFGAGDECHMAFHFPLMPRLFMAIHMEDRFPIIDILQQTPAIPETSQWALFLRNHDELTLEMVTDEDRDYMYRVYAREAHARLNLGIRRRLAPLLENHRAMIELMNALLFSLPGTPVIYYGDEIGMGDNMYLGDRNGVRTPMQWNPERNAGFSRANPQRLYLPVIIDPEYHYQTVNAEAQQNNPHSLLWWMKRLIALRKRHQAFGRGTLEFLTPDNHKVLAFLRRYQDEKILVVANLSRFVQSVELDLAALKGTVPVEMLGRTALPLIKDQPYPLTLGPYACYWLALESQPAARPPVASAEGRLPMLEVKGTWESVFRGRARENLEKILLVYVGEQRWFVRKDGPKTARIVEIIPISPPPSLLGKGAGGLGEEPKPLPQPLPEAGRREKKRQIGGAALGYLTLVQVEYAEGEPQTYVVPLAFAAGPRAQQVQNGMPQAIICQLKVRNLPPASVGDGSNGEGGMSEKDGDQMGLLYDPLGEKDFSKALLAAFAHRRRLKGSNGELAAWTTPAFHRLGGPSLIPQVEPVPPPSLPPTGGGGLGWGQSNTSVAFGDRLLLKVFRGLQEGVHPEVEIGRFLTERAGFTHAPPVAGGLDYRFHPASRSGPAHARQRPESMTVAALFGFVPNEGDAWRFTLDALRRYNAQVLTQQARFQDFLLPNKSFLDLVEEDLPSLAQELIGSYLESARLMGRRTAELHQALASISDRPEFAPEPFTFLYQRSLYQTVRTQALRMFDHLREQMPHLPEEVRGHAQQVLQHQSEVLQHLRSILERRISAQRLRCHGDYRLNDLLHTGKDFIIIDFEGEVMLPLSNRRHKRSPLRDVASLLHSFYFAARTALKEGGMRPEDIPTLEPWARVWHRWVSVAFVKAYLQTVAHDPFLPKSRDDIQLLLGFYVLARSVFEIDHQLRNHPDRVDIPLRGILHILELRGRKPGPSTAPDRTESDGAPPTTESGRPQPALPPVGEGGGKGSGRSTPENPP